MYTLGKKNKLFCENKVQRKNRFLKSGIQPLMESGIHGCGIRNPQTWNPESTAWNPESTAWNPESKTLVDYLTWGELKLERKFNNLKRRYGIPMVSNLGHDKIIFNYSHRALTEAEKMVLARGLRFCLPPKSVDSFNVKCSFEMLYRDLLGLDYSLSSEDKDRLKCQLAQKCLLHLHLLV